MIYYVSKGMLNSTHSLIVNNLPITNHITAKKYFSYKQKQSTQRQQVWVTKKQCTIDQIAQTGRMDALSIVQPNSIEAMKKT